MVPLDIPREPFYRKELDVVISRSYGPGRYDPAYEEGGQDYPYGFVRWTEQRNMAAVLGAIAAGGLRVDSLITHRFPFERATDAYDIVSGKVDEPHVGIVLEYPEEAGLQSTVAIARGGAVSPAPAGQMPGVAFIAAGSFARGSLLPHVKSRTDIRRVAVATARGYTAVDAARKFGFGEASSDGGAL